MIVQIVGLPESRGNFRTQNYQIGKISPVSNKLIIKISVFQVFIHNHKLFSAYVGHFRYEQKVVTFDKKIDRKLNKT